MLCFRTQYCTGVHNAKRIKRIFYRTQHRKLDRIAVFFKIAHFQSTNAVFCADGTVHAVHQIMHDTFNLRPFFFIISAAFSMHREHVVVQISITQMSKAIDAEIADLSQSLLAAYDEIGNHT